MIKNIIIALLLTGFSGAGLIAQDTSTYSLRVDFPLLDMPQNKDLPYRVPSMQQALHISSGMYDLGFLGIDKLGDRLFLHKHENPSGFRKFGNHAFKYGMGLLFSKYGSELPIPLGVWGHEEFHRSVLGVNGIDSKNGNWFLHRWDGTVYGISDSSLTQLKSGNVNQLLYAYVSGIQYEIALSEKISLEDFYKKRSLHKNALLLYNAYYVYNYFNFSTSAMSDSVKVLAPPHEDANSSERDFAGADLTAWAYDMFNPDAPYQIRDSFPNGLGVNRRIGFSDLSEEAQSFLLEQKKLSLLNFFNPALFFINRIKISNNLSFNIFTQYAPTYFGNAISVFLPVQYRQFDVLGTYSRYNSHDASGFGFGLGIYNYRMGNKTEFDLNINYWQQPDSFYGNQNNTGGSVKLKAKYAVGKRFVTYLALSAKSKGWCMGNPYIDQNFSFGAGLQFKLSE